MIPGAASARRILIIRPSAIGDIVMASPLLTALRRTAPDAHIAWLVEPALAPLLTAHPDLNEVLVWPKAAWKEWFKSGRWLRLALEMVSFAGELKKRRFDLALDVQGLLRSRWLAWLSGAPERIGFESREPGRWLLTRLVSRGPESKEMSSEYKHLAGLLGLDTSAFEPRLVPAGEDRLGARRLLAAAGIAGDFVVIAPFTTRPQKHWLEDRWVELSLRLRNRYSWPLVMLGGAGDRVAAARIRRAADSGLVDLAGRTSLGEAAAIIERARLVIGVDTGIAHMGVAFHRPLVVLFGSTCPYLTTAQPTTQVLHAGFPCSPCRRRPTCDGRHNCMAALEVPAVLAAGARALAVEEPRP